MHMVWVKLRLLILSRYLLMSTWCTWHHLFKDNSFLCVLLILAPWSFVTLALATPSISAFSGSFLTGKNHTSERNTITWPINISSTLKTILADGCLVVWTAAHFCHILNLPTNHMQDFPRNFPIYLTWYPLEELGLACNNLGSKI